MTAPKRTCELLRRLRKLMKDTTVTSGHVLSAYIVPSCDAHQSEYLCDADQRRSFLSGFDGSAGTAIVLSDGNSGGAYLWTDERYRLQAQAQLDANWTLMVEGGTTGGAITRQEWLETNIESGSAVGVDPYLMPASEFSLLTSALSNVGIKLIAVENNLVDSVWGLDRPARPDNPIVPLELEFTGETWESKVIRVRERMRSKSCDLLVLSALDDVAWLLNLRGSDIPNNPVFFAYCTVARDKVQLFVNQGQVTDAVVNHLTSGNNDVKVELRPYEAIKGFLQAASQEGAYKKIWFSSQASQAIASFVTAATSSAPDTKRRTSTLFAVTPVTLMKAVKNETEIRGFGSCHVRDSAALCSYLAWLEKNVGKGNVTELSGAARLLEFRQQMLHFVQPSFTTISAVGSNSAVIHYHPTLDTDRIITIDDIYLVDSGGQYKDGTTDVTRTVHFGTPSQHQRECFTRVLKGQLRLAATIFPNRTVGSRLDALARTALWQVGLDYKHGTGHGVGSYLNVHEGPMGISWRTYPDDPGLQCGMVLSNEPGYYEAGNFGVRLENLVKVVQVDVNKHRQNDDVFLGFENLTFVPIQTKMILPELLSKEELDHLNEYHELCRDRVGSLLRELGHTDGLHFLIRETEPLG